MYPNGATCSANYYPANGNVLLASTVTMTSGVKLTVEYVKP